MSQLTFAEAEYEHKKRKTRREVFLEKLDQLLPWKALESTIAVYYASGSTGRPPYALSSMLRIRHADHLQPERSGDGRCLV